MTCTTVDNRARLDPLHRLTNLEVLCRFLAAVAYDFILNDLVFVEGAQSRTLDGGNMHEYVLATALRLNESVSFLD